MRFTAFADVNKNYSNTKFSLPASLLSVSGYSSTPAKYFCYSEHEKLASVYKKHKTFAGALLNRVFSIYKKKLPFTFNNVFSKYKNGAKAKKKNYQFSSQLVTNLFQLGYKKRKSFSNAAFFNKTKSLFNTQKKIKGQLNSAPSSSPYTAKKKLRAAPFFLDPLYLKSKKNKNFFMRTFLLFFLFNTFFFEKKTNLNFCSQKKVSTNFMDSLLSYKFYSGRLSPPLASSRRNYLSGGTAINNLYGNKRLLVFFNNKKLNNLLFWFDSALKVDSSSAAAVVRDLTNQKKQAAAGAIRKKKISFYLFNVKNIFKTKNRKIFYPAQKLIYKRAKR
jgi:hypothetical protein